MATQSKYSPEDFKTIKEVCIEGGKDYVTRVVVSVTEHIESGNQFVGIRKFYKNAEGQLLPTKNGINFPTVLLPQILEQLLAFVGDSAAQPAPVQAAAQKAPAKLASKPAAKQPAAKQQPKAAAQKKPVETFTGETRVIDLSASDVPF